MCNENCLFDRSDKPPNQLGNEMLVAPFACTNHMFEIDFLLVIVAIQTQLNAGLVNQKLRLLYFGLCLYRPAVMRAKHSHDPIRDYLLCRIIQPSIKGHPFVRLEAKGKEARFIFKHHLMCICLFNHLYSLFYIICASTVIFYDSLSFQKWLLCAHFCRTDKAYSFQIYTLLI